MTDPEDLSDAVPDGPPAPPPKPPEPPMVAYQAALGRYEGIRLREVHEALGLHDLGLKPRALPGAIADNLRDPRRVERLIGGLDGGPRRALGLFALTETTAWPLVGLVHALTCLGVEPRPALGALTRLGLLALRADGDGPLLSDLVPTLEGPPAFAFTIHAHPTVLIAARTVLPEGEAPPSAGPVRQPRATDGLEPVLRLAALWQRVLEAPLRQTQQGVLYKRDRDRLEDDPVLAGPIADMLEPLPDMAGLWLVLAREVGLVVSEPGGDRISAAPAEFWAENAIHLPQMIAQRWLALRTWHEQGGLRHEGSTVALALPFLRPVALLWLATLDADAWVGLDDLAAHLQTRTPDWALPAFVGPADADLAARGRSRGPKSGGKAAARGPDSEVLAALLLGAAYQFGLVRAAEEVPTGRRVVQLSALGRYLLALGPPPPPRPAFDQFLFVQPNFEIIAYRQGLTPTLIGLLSRFTLWSQVGAALELKLTAESVYRGLESGLAPGAMHDLLGRHSSRPLPTGVAEALRTWAERRERITYHAAATLIEFASREDLEQALGLWPATTTSAPIPVSDRLLLIEDESATPFQRFRMTGARDYRRPAEACLEVEPDGVTLTLDLARSDLLIDAEIIRFSDEQPRDAPPGAPGSPRRRFLVSPESLARGAEQGLTPSALGDWFLRRTGQEVPPAIRLLLLAGSKRVGPLATQRPIVLNAPSEEVLDGLLQHPDTRAFFGDRLGPTTVVVPDALLAPLRRAAERLGLTLLDPPNAAGT